MPRLIARLAGPGLWATLLATFVPLWTSNKAFSQPLEPPVLSILPRSDNEPRWFRIDAAGPSNAVYSLDASRDFGAWTNLAVTLDSLARYPAVGSDLQSQQFYRVRLSEKSSTNDWKNQVHFPIDPFTSSERNFIPNDIQWIKFALLLDDPVRVYYQDSRQHLFHYDWATLRLEPFRGMSPAQFDAVSLRTNGQQVLLGTVLYPPAPNEAELGIQFVGLDPYPLEMVAHAFKLVEATVVAPEGARAFYMPAFEQVGAAEQNKEAFLKLGIEISSAARWLAGDQCYATGWALGRLTFVTATEIDQAYASGQLLPTDILITDDVPAEIPFVAGVLSLAPATPNSHVAILSQSFGIPFAHVVDTLEQARILALAGRKIVLRVEHGFEFCEVRIFDVQEEMTPALELEILELKQPPQLNIAPKQRLGSYSASTDGLARGDVRYFGGKAAHYGYLRRSIPDHADVAIAFSFDLWDDFLDQLMPGGLTLREAILNRLAGYTYPPNMASLKADLADIREMIRVTAAFPSALQQVVTNALTDFDPARKIRFRSSTNVEDTEQFVGAGLYDSFSGCLWDDLDGDTVGPSHCDADEDNERGVFRAIKRVYASFYNDNAFLERLRHGVDESQVGMALLVHHSFPDELEWANGVAALDVTFFGNTMQLSGDMVTQDGALPVTNPEGGALPEVVSAYRYGTSSYLNLKQRSNLLPLGEYVLDWESDYQQFMSLFAAVAGGFSAAFPAKSRFILDFEYKEVAPGDLVIKQVRELPLPDTTTLITPFLLQESNRFCVFQGEFGDVMANHRLKSMWQFTTRNLRLAESNLVETFFESIDLEYLNEGMPATLSGPPAEWEGATHEVSGGYATNGWSLGVGKARRNYQLITQLIEQIPVSANPLFTLSDFTLWWSVTYADPRPGLNYSGLPTLVTNEIVRLAPCPSINAESLKQTRYLTNNQVSVETSFYWPKHPTGVVAGYTAPLIAWEQSIIRGLTQQPIVLTGHYSQTYRPGHHNFTEDFVFEPRLEPGLDPALLAELESNNILLLHVMFGWQGDPMQILGLDGTWRPASPTDPTTEAGR